MLIIQSEGSAGRKKSGHDWFVCFLQGKMLEDNWPLAGELNSASRDLELKGEVFILTKTEVYHSFNHHLVKREEA